VKTNIQLRLECLRVANAFCISGPQKAKPKSDDDVVRIAQKYFDWVSGADKASARDLLSANVDSTDDEEA